MYSTLLIVSTSWSSKCTPFLFSFFLHSVIDSIVHPVAYLHFFTMAEELFFSQVWPFRNARPWRIRHKLNAKSTKPLVRHKCLLNRKKKCWIHFLKTKWWVMLYVYTDLLSSSEFLSKLSDRSYFCSLYPMPQSDTKVRFCFYGCQHFRITFFKINHNNLIFKTIITNFFLLSSVKPSFDKKHLYTHTFHDAFNFISG